MAGAIDVGGIIERLPHRYPMLLVDRVTSLVPGESITALKAVSVNEPHFPGHFPGRPIMPGVLIVEALAQAAGVLALESLGDEGRGKLVYFLGIDKARFRRPVEPGHLLALHVRQLQARRQVSRFAGEASIEGVLAAEAEFTAMIADHPAG